LYYKDTFFEALTEFIDENIKLLSSNDSSYPVNPTTLLSNISEYIKIFSQFFNELDEEKRYLIYDKINKINYQE
jgi:hypothetical protein